MGRTLLPPTALIKQEKEQWADYRRALRKEDRVVFDRLFSRALCHSGEIACAEKTYPFEGMLISMLIEQEKYISELSQRLLTLEGENRQKEEAGTPAALTLPEPVPFRS